MNMAVNNLRTISVSTEGKLPDYATTSVLYNGACYKQHVTICQERFIFLTRYAYNFLTSRLHGVRDNVCRSKQH